MTHEELLKFARDTFDKMIKTIERKNHDYTAQGSAFANFEQAEDYGVDPVVGLCVRMGDKSKRIQTFCKSGGLKVLGEGVEDAFMDQIGYSVIALAMLHERKELDAKADGQEKERTYEDGLPIIPFSYEQWKTHERRAEWEYRTPEEYIREFGDVPNLLELYEEYVDSFKPRDLQPLKRNEP